MIKDELKKFPPECIGGIVQVRYIIDSILNIRYIGPLNEERVD